MSAGVWIFLGLVAVAIAILLKGKNGGTKAAPENDVLSRFREQDALAPELVQECVRAAKALPIVDEKTSGLFHDPVYDARTDQFDPPCKENDFQWSTGNCWLTPDTVHEVFEVYADHEASFKLGLSRPRTACVVAADDHLDILLCPSSVNEPGLSVMRLSRVAEDRWHVYRYTCGFGATGMGIVGGNLKILLTSGADDMDPPLKAVDVAQDPTLWTRRNDRLRSRWTQNGHWRDAAALCTHKGQG